MHASHFQEIGVFQRPEQQRSKYYSFTGLTEIQPGLCSFYFSSKYRFCRVGFRQVKRNVRKPVTLFLLCALAVCLIHENGGCNRCV